MTKEQMFYKALQDVFIGAKIEGEGGFINLMRIKSNYYSQIENILQKDINDALRQYSNFREELFDKLYTFFSRYFTESGSIYFNSTPFHNNIYEKVYTDDHDVILFWKTQMLYYVKTDRIFKSMPIEVEGIKFRFDASTIENKKANEKRSLIYELKDMEDDKTIIFSVYYSEKGRKTKEDDILKEIKKKHISITEEQLEKAFRVFEKQSEVDFFINKNARQFLQEQFKLWSYQYFWDGASYWTQDRVNQLQILKDVAFKIIDFISQFEDELVKIWNKPKFVLNSNYVITLDKIIDTEIPLAPFSKGGIGEESNPPAPFSKGGIGEESNPPAPFSKGGSREILIKILSHPNLDLQIKEWKELGIVDEGFTVEDIFEDEVNNNWEERKSPGLFDKNELKQRGLITTGFHLPYNPDLKLRARELRKNMTEPERKIWYEYLRNFKYQVLRQKPLDNYIVDFYCPELKLIIEIDGDTHFTEEGKVYDEERTRILEGYGLKIIRFLNTDIMRNLAGVVQEIEKEIHQIPLAPFSKGGIGEESNPPAPFSKGGISEESSPPAPFGKGGIGEESNPLVPFSKVGIGEGSNPLVLFSKGGIGEESSPPAPFGKGGIGEESSPPAPFGKGGIGEESNPPAPFGKGGIGEESSPPAPFGKGGIGEESNPPAPFSKGGLRGVCQKYKHLPIDTKYFKDLELEILSLFDDLDNQLDGWLIKSENYQALNTLLPKFKERVKCIHIDPPYNTETSGFLYANTYQHSSWLTMMENRIRNGFELISRDGSFLCHIDENEYEHLQLLFEQFSIANAGTIVWDKRNPMNAGRGVAKQHEYIIWRSRQETPIYLRNDSILSMLSVAAEIVKKHGGVTEKAQKEYAAWVNNNSELTGGEKAYRFLDAQGRVYQSVSLRAPEPRSDAKFHRPLIHPATGKPCPIPPNGFSRTPETLRAMVEKDEIIFGNDETIQPRQKVILTQETNKQISSVIQDARKGKADLDSLGLDFPYCHPVSLYKKLIGTVSTSNDDVVLDFFAGSGTTAHAVINLNRKDSKKRKYILIEMGNYFNSTIIPRVKKVVFSDTWKNGKACEGKGISHFIKYYELEQYEETLRNCKYEDGDLLTIPDRSPYQEYVFLKDEKLLKSLDIDYENNKVKVDLTKLDFNKIPPTPFNKGGVDGESNPPAPFSKGGVDGESNHPAPFSKGDKGIDIPETLSNLTGKWIKKITAETVLFEDGNEINYKDLDYKQIKPLIWW